MFLLNLGCPVCQIIAFIFYLRINSLLAEPFSLTRHPKNFLDRSEILNKLDNFINTSKPILNNGLKSNNLSSIRNPTQLHKLYLFAFIFAESMWPLILIISQILDDFLTNEWKRKQKKSHTWKSQPRRPKKNLIPLCCSG